MDDDFKDLRKRHGTVIKMERNEVVEILHKQAIERLGINAHELVRKFKAGEFTHAEISDIFDLVILAGTLADDDSLYL